MTNPLLQEIAPKIEERDRAIPAMRDSLSDAPAKMIPEVREALTVLVSLCEIQNNEAKRLIAEVERLQSLNDELARETVNIAYDQSQRIARLEQALSESNDKLAYFQHKSVADSINYDTGADDAFRECEAIVKEITLEMAKGFTGTPRSFSYSGGDIATMFGNIAGQFEKRVQAIRQLTAPASGDGAITGDK